MKKTAKFYSIISLLFSLFLLHSFSTLFFTNFLITKVYADRDSKRDAEEKDDHKEEDKDDDKDEDEDKESDEEDDFKRSSNSIKVAPVESKVNAQPQSVSAEPNLQPILFTPQVIQNQFKESMPKIEVSIPTIPSNDQIKQIITNVKDFNGIVSSINLKEAADGVLNGEVVTTQKILGLFDVQIPYNISLDSVSGTIKEKLPKNIWSSFLDFISF